MWQSGESRGKGKWETLWRAADGETNVTGRFWEGLGWSEVKQRRAKKTHSLSNFSKTSSTNSELTLQSSTVESGKQCTNGISKVKMIIPTTTWLPAVMHTQTERGALAIPRLRPWGRCSHGIWNCRKGNFSSGFVKFLSADQVTVNDCRLGVVEFCSALPHLVCKKSHGGASIAGKEKGPEGSAAVGDPPRPIWVSWLVVAT